MWEDLTTVEEISSFHRSKKYSQGFVVQGGEDEGLLSSGDLSGDDVRSNSLSGCVGEIRTLIQSQICLSVSVIRINTFVCQ